MVARLRPYLPAMLLACVLTLAWSWGSRAELTALQLPDTDDLMRLQQVRDWLAGQAFGDVTQYRLADGVAMHWSRLPDLPLAALILALRPLIGAHAAEVAAVILWPALQLAALLALVSSIAERLRPGARLPATVLAALAFPAIPLFAPGRIDHHAVQMLLVLAQLLMLLRPPTFVAGALAGVAAAAGAVIGLETAPFALVTGAIVATRGGAVQRGFGFGLALALGALMPFSASGPTCDTVAPLAGVVVMGGLALAFTASLGRSRWIALGAAAVILPVLFRADVSACAAGPYGAVDPLLARVWLAKVQEAQPLLSLAPVDIFRFAGLLLAGVVAGAWCAWRRGSEWIVVLAYQLGSLAITLVQLRGDYLGTLLAVVPIAALLTEARAAGKLARTLGLWVAGAGFVYPLAANAIAPPPWGGEVGCSVGDVVRELNRLPKGRVLAPIDFGAAIIAGTPHTAIAAPYHRSNAANAAMYRFFLDPSAAAEPIARGWRVDYVVMCPDALSTKPSRESIASGVRPTWLTPIRSSREGPGLFRVVPPLPGTPNAR
jgi:hypothetical protein